MDKKARRTLMALTVGSVIVGAGIYALVWFGVSAKEPENLCANVRADACGNAEINCVTACPDDEMSCLYKCFAATEKCHAGWDRAIAEIERAITSPEYESTKKMLLDRDKLGLQIRDFTYLMHERKGLDIYVNFTLSSPNEILNQVVYHINNEDVMRTHDKRSRAIGMKKRVNGSGQQV